MITKQEYFIRKLIREELDKLNEDYSLDVQFNKEAQRVQNKILKNINKDSIKYTLLDESDFVKTTEGRNVRLYGIKFNLNQIEAKYNVDVVFCENNIGNIGGGYHSSKNLFIFPLFDTPHINRSLFPEDRPSRKLYTIEEYKYYVKIRFKYWLVDENIFLHEFVHFLDKNRYGDTYSFTQPSERSEYYNSPEEYNSYTQEIITKILKNKNKLKDLAFDVFLKKVLNFGNEDFIKSLNDKYTKKLNKRLYQIYINL